MRGKRYLVTGASGFVGRSLCQQLVAEGVTVRGVYRSAPTEPPGGIERSLIGAIDGQTDWSGALQGVEVVIHLAARVHVMRDDQDDPLSEFRRINTAGTEHLARCAAASGVRRLVYVSSIKVNGEATLGGDKFTEVDAPGPQDPYGISKCEAEQALHRVAAETGLEVVIVRPPLVYGPHVKGNFAQMLRVLAKGIPLPLSLARNQRSLVYVANLADALVTCANHPAATGQTYLVSDGEDISTPDLLRRLGAALGRPPRLFPCPLFLLKLAGALTGKAGQIERLLGSLQIDSGKIRRELNWTPPIGLQQGLQETAEWYCRTHQ